MLDQQVNEPHRIVNLGTKLYDLRSFHFVSFPKRCPNPQSRVNTAFFLTVVLNSSVHMRAHAFHARTHWPEAVI